MSGGSEVKSSSDGPASLPLVRMRNLQHRLTRLVNAIQRIERVEVDAPPRGRVLDRDEIVAEDHLRRCNFQSGGHGLNGAGFENRKLLR